MPRTHRLIGGLQLPNVFHGRGMPNIPIFPGGTFRLVHVGVESYDAEITPFGLQDMLVQSVTPVFGAQRQNFRISEVFNSLRGKGFISLLLRNDFGDCKSRVYNGDVIVASAFVGRVPREDPLSDGADYVTLQGLSACTDKDEVRRIGGDDGTQPIVAVRDLLFLDSEQNRLPGVVVVYTARAAIEMLQMMLQHQRQPWALSQEVIADLLQKCGAPPNLLASPM